MFRLFFSEGENKAISFEGKLALGGVNFPIKLPDSKTVI
jgi:hypothetical protein